ncbi:uncharacterized protein KIAA0825-like [Haliotis rufescens]|uniref:uncharacterized protein KIAA0825-like n=1 Tax=Haliotis rufescens TaxID=6454 RepID=UPI00201FAF62|nr:uncharacterized protein KIAA0825-like [Haliotis rufescens]
MDVTGLNHIGDPAQLPSFKALLRGGPVPSTAALDVFITDLDIRLDQNSKELDVCLQSVLDFTNELPGSKCFTSPKEGLTHMHNSHVLEKDSCYDPEMEDVMAMLTYLHKTLEQCPGCEEAVLQEILTLSSIEGLSLPLKASDTDSMSMSMVSLNMVVDSGDQLIEQKWKKVTQLLKKHFVDRLLQLPVSMMDSNLNVLVNMRLNLLQSLRAIAPDEDVWNRYRSLRTQQLEKCFSDMLPEQPSENTDYKAFSHHCNAMADIIISMLDEDFIVLNTGMFTKVTGVFKALHDLYLEKYSDEMSLLVEEVCDEISEVRSKGLAQSHSEFGFQSNHHGTMAKGGLAQSLDSMVTTSTAAQAAPAEPKSYIPQTCMKSLLQILCSILKIEEHVDQLLRNTSWDVCGLAGKKSKRKGSLRGVLKPSSSPEMSRHSMNLSGLSNSETNLDGSVSSSVSSLHSSTAAPKVIERTKTEDRLHWDWKIIFKKVSSDLTHAVEADLHEVMSNGLDIDLRQWETSRKLETCNVPEILHGGKLDYPKVVSKAVFDFFSAADNLLPLARAGRDGTFQTVRSAFIEAINLGLKNFNVHFTKLCKDVPSQAPLFSMYVIMSSAAYIRNQLVHYEKVLVFDEAGKKPFCGLYKQFVELTDSLTQQVIELHTQLISTSILHDAEGGDWANMKDFYEDERCSFTIQMWNYHLRALQSDLWSVAPPQMAQHIFSLVLKESLTVIAHRYVRVKPSFKRVKQFRYDLTAVLLCTEEFLLHTSSSVSHILDPGHTDQPAYTIHNLCSTIFSALAIVSSPLEILYRVYKKGYGRRRDSHEEFSLHLATSYTGSNTHWLHWIRPELYHTNQKHFDDMQTTMAVYVQLQMLLHQPDPHWGKLLQLLIMKEFTVSILLLTRSMETIRATEELVIQIETATNKLATVPTIDTNQLTVAKTLFQSVVNILALSQSFPDALVKSLLPVIDRCKDWDSLNIKGLAASPEFKPPFWMEAIFSVIEPLIQRVLGPVLDYMMMLPTSTASLDPLIMKISELPCGCPPCQMEPNNNRKPPALKAVMDGALKILISELSESVLCLRTPVCLMFNVLQEACTERKIKTGHSCVGLQLIAASLKCKLQDTEYLEKAVGLSFHPDMLKQIASLAECVYHVLAVGRSKNQNTPKLASKFCKSHKEWMAQKFHIISSHFMNDIFCMPDSDILEGATTAYSDQVFTAMASSTIDAATGLHDLQTVHNTVHNNGVWLLQQMDVKPVVSKEGVDRVQHFTFNIAKPKPKPFIPVKEFCRLGDCDFDQDYILHFPFKWSEMLQSDLGLSEHGFRSLLFHRHEMQDGAFLEDVEKKPVEVLKAKFDSETM